MSRARHVPANDFDPDPTPGKPGKPVKASEHGTRCRKIAARRTLDAARAVEIERLVVTCPNRSAPPLDECTTCAHFKGFSLDPSQRDSYVSCAFTADGEHGWPIPVGISARGRAMRTHLSEIMKDAVCVRPDVPVKEIAAIMGELGIGGVPVIDASGRLVGMVSKTDIVRSRKETLTANDLASRPVVTLPKEATVAEAAALMSEKELHRIPIVSDGDHVIGIVSSLDVMRWLSRADGGRNTSPVTPASL